MKCDKNCGRVILSVFQDMTCMYVFGVIGGSTAFSASLVTMYYVITMLSELFVVLFCGGYWFCNVIGVYDCDF